MDSDEDHDALEPPADFDEDRQPWPGIHRLLVELAPRAIIEGPVAASIRGWSSLQAAVVWVALAAGVAALLMGYFRLAESRPLVASG